MHVNDRKKERKKERDRERQRERERERKIEREEGFDASAYHTHNNIIVDMSKMCTDRPKKKRSKRHACIYL